MKPERTTTPIVKTDGRTHVARSHLIMYLPWKIDNSAYDVRAIQNITPLQSKETRELRRKEDEGEKGKEKKRETKKKWV